MSKEAEFTRTKNHDHLKFAVKSVFIYYYIGLEIQYNVVPYTNVK